MTPNHRTITAILLAACMLLGGCRSGESTPDYTRIDGSTFGTHYRIDYLSGPDADEVQAAVENELDRIDWIASTWKPESELMRYNRATDPASFPLSPDLDRLLKRSEELRVLTDGAFNVRYDPPQVDLSAIAKGDAVDRISDLLAERFGIQSSMVDIGGEVKVRGPGPHGDSWRIGLYLPTPAGAATIDPPVVNLRDNSVATSGTYFRGPHLIDPRSGEPVSHDLISASVIHPSNATADALATAIYVMGPKEGTAWAKQHGIHAIFLFEDGTVQEYQPEK